MFIPVEKKPQWQNPPILTILLILISSGCYFTWQTNDTASEAASFQYYISSGLASIEVPAYIQYLQSHNKPVTNLKDLLMKDKQRGYRAALQKLIVDGAFLKQLQNNQIIRTDNPKFTQWQQRYKEFNRLKERIVKYRFGLKPYDYNLESLVIHNFLHDSVNHLVLNMIFLFMFGFIIELAIGRAAYLFVFLSSGIMSAFTLVLINPQSAHWVVGASGAIAGLVGFYTMLYGLRKIKFFYSVIVYFGYVTAPALMLLPVWLIYELINQFYFSDQVSNLSHIGGLAFGAFLGFIYKRYPQLIHQQTLEDNSLQLQFKKKFQLAINNIAQLKFNTAHKILNELLINQPNNFEIIKQLYNLEKINPHTDQYHVFTHQLIKLAIDRSGNEKFIHSIYKEYSNIAKPSAKFTTDLLYSLARIFSTNNYMDDAGKICLYLLKNDDSTDKQPELLLGVINGFKKINNPEQLAYYKNLLLNKFPESKQAKIVNQY